MKNNKFNNIVLYDGDCGFCSFWVQFLLKYDQKNILKFAALQGNFGQNFLKNNQLETVNFDTIYFLKDNKIFQKSSAIIEILASLQILFKIFLILKLIPKFLRDFVYDKISENRKSLMNVNCLLPTKEQRKQFID